MPAYADVPDRFDVVFGLNDGTFYGFLLADSLESNLPFRTHKASYTYSATFLERQNVSNLYGDNFQDFFLTGSQNDFSLGEQQQYFRVNDADRQRRYWKGSKVDPTSVPGQVSLAYDVTSLTGLTVTAVVPSVQTTSLFFMADATNLYSYNGTTQTTIGAHGLGIAPNKWGICTDGDNVFLSTENASGVGIRKYVENGGGFSTFSSTKISSLIFNNNILYGYQQSSSSLISFDASGNPTTQFQWKDAAGSAVGANSPVAKLVAYGGAIYILRQRGYSAAAEIWQFDASGARIVAQLPTDFIAGDLCISNGIMFIGGTAEVTSGTYKPTVYYFFSGSLGKLWASVSTASTAVPSVPTPYGNGILFTNPATGSILQYDLAYGGVHSVFAATIAGNNTFCTNGNSSALYLNGSTAYYWPNNSSSYPSQGFIQSSLYDFDNTLSKVYRGIKVDASLPANTSIDLLYQIDGLTGAYTSLQVGATPGTEYLLPANTNGHSISVQVNLNSSTNVNTPILKRIYVRAAPTLQQFRKREFIFDLSGGYRSTKGKVARVCRDGTPYPYDGITAATNLLKIATQTIPFTVQDRFAQYTALTDLQDNQAGFDGFAIYEMHPGVYLARINLREV